MDKFNAFNIINNMVDRIFLILTGYFDNETG